MTLQDGVLVCPPGRRNGGSLPATRGPRPRRLLALLDCGLPVQSLEISMGLEHSSGHPARQSRGDAPLGASKAPGVPVSPASPTPGRSSPVTGIDFSHETPPGQVLKLGARLPIQIRGTLVFE